jgi:hypothetical protein
LISPVCGLGDQWPFFIFSQPQIEAREFLLSCWIFFTAWFISPGETWRPILIPGVLGAAAVMGKPSGAVSLDLEEKRGHHIIEVLKKIFELEK